MKNNLIMEGVIVPLMQSFVTGLLLSLCCLLGISVGEEMDMGWKIFEIPYLMSMFVLLVGTTFFWFVFSENHKNRIDSVYGLNVVPVKEPVKKQSTINLRVFGDAGGNFLNLSCTNDKLIAFAKGITNGKGFTVRSWVNAGMFSAREFENFRDELILYGYAKWKDGPENRKGGVVLTKKGTAILGYLATMDHSPTPTGLLVKRANIR